MSTATPVLWQYLEVDGAHVVATVALRHALFAATYDPNIPGDLLTAKRKVLKRVSEYALARMSNPDAVERGTAMIQTKSHWRYDDPRLYAVKDIVVFHPHCGYQKAQVRQRPDGKRYVILLGHNKVFLHDEVWPADYTWAPV